MIDTEQTEVQHLLGVVLLQLCLMTALSRARPGKFFVFCKKLSLFLISDNIQLIVILICGVIDDRISITSMTDSSFVKLDRGPKLWNQYKSAIDKFSNLGRFPILISISIKDIHYSSHMCQSRVDTSIKKAKIRAKACSIYTFCHSSFWHAITFL